MIDLNKKENNSEGKNFNTKNNLKKIISTELIFGIQLVLIIVFAWFFVEGIKAYAMQPFIVEGDSMEPNFHTNEYLLVDELSYKVRKPERGEVIVFKWPKDHEKYYIKRIICLPGETCKIEDNSVYYCQDEEALDCKLIDQSYLSETAKTKPNKKVTLKDDEYFVMGDNRMWSSDSRSWGPVSKNEIIGKVWVRAWPFDRIDIF